MKGSAELHVFQSVRRHLSDARRCATVMETCPVPALRDAAAVDFDKAVRGLIADLGILDAQIGLERIGLILDSADTFRSQRSRN